LANELPTRPEPFGSAENPRGEISAKRGSTLPGVFSIVIFNEPSVGFWWNVEFVVPVGGSVLSSSNYVPFDSKACRARKKEALVGPFRLRVSAEI
jgi:hypothetical protein